MGKVIIMKRYTNQKGYITLEAAIILPVFILAVVSIIYYITVFSVVENVAYCNIEETAKLASAAGTVKVSPAFPEKLEKRIHSENHSIENLDTKSFRYLYWDGDLDNMIAVNETYEVALKLPLGFDHRIKLDSRIKCRGFTGKRVSGDSMSFDEMEMAGVWEPVWIFPMSGEKYHASMCTYVKANAREMVLTYDIKKRYDPCTLCGAESSITGTYVYCFTDNGTVYHKSDCHQVSRYAVEINKEDAENKGYTPCSKCGGG